MTGYYLLKTEPSDYSYADLSKVKQTVWDGVANPAALKNLRSMQSGDRVLIYETGEVRSVVGTASVASVKLPDPKVPEVTVKVGKRLPKAIPLSDIKTMKLFADSALVRQGRLSVVTLSEAQYRHLSGG